MEIGLQLFMAYYCSGIQMVYRGGGVLPPDQVFFSLKNLKEEKYAFWTRILAVLHAFQVSY